METDNAPLTSDFLTEVADQMDATADQLDCCANGQTNGQVVAASVASGGIWPIKFAEKLVYTTSYTLSFGVCFPVFLVCHYIPKNNPVVRGLIAGGEGASAKADAWLTRSIVANPAATESPEDVLVAEAGAGALAPA
ncbi:MAG: hypothetical protein JWN70_3190 [Planctomycetaceae bacterium]|nr:hypothetical protein [Planctomycetaceae bacterium]